MVHAKYRLSARQAILMGMLSSDAGLAVMGLLLGGFAQSPIIGASPMTYWVNLLQNAPSVPHMFSSITLPAPKPFLDPQSTATSSEVGSHAKQTVLSEDIQAMVVRVVSAILGLEATSIDSSIPLALQGLDSLAGLELRQKLQEALGVELALMAEDPQGATIQSIVNEAVTKIPTRTSSSSSAALIMQTASNSNEKTAERVLDVGPPWISPTPVTVKLRLFCLPWAGGVSENLFARWSMMLPASIQVCPVEIPGRGRRLGEPAPATVAELATLLAQSLPLKDKPYVIFGTCLGAIVGYELVREVERTRSAPLPLAFMPAAVSPPHVYASVVMKIYLQRRLRWGEEPPLEEVMRTLHGWRDMPREKLLLAFEAGHFAGVEEMKHNARLFDRVAPMGVADIMMAVQYRYDASQPPLDIPLIAFDGVRDNTIPSGYMKGWRRHTRGRYRHVRVDGTHYFVSTHYKEVTAQVGQECVGLMEGMKGGVLGAQHSWVGDTNVAAEGSVEEANASSPRGGHSSALVRRDMVTRWSFIVLFMHVLAFLLWWRSSMRF